MFISEYNERYLKKYSRDISYLEMKEERTPDNKLVDAFIKHIKSNDKLYGNYFGRYKNRKYDIRQLILIIVKVLRLGIPWREIHQLKISEDIYWNTVYKTYKRLLADDIIQKSFEESVKLYLKKKPESKLKIQLTDTSNVSNKLGEECVGRNKTAKNKNITKITLITDSQGIPLDADIHAGNIHDSKIFQDQMTKVGTKFSNANKKRKFLADKGYDSKKIKLLLKNKGYITIIPHNKRNTKDKNKMKQLTTMEKETLQKRVKVEHAFMKIKRYRRLNVRYDRKYETYKGFLLMALIDIIHRCIT
jgi:transposase